MKSLLTVHLRRFTVPEIVSFSERTFEWIVSASRAHLSDHADKYSFTAKDVLVANDSDASQPLKVLVTCSEEATSQWYIHHFLGRGNAIIYAFAKPSANFSYLQNTFKLNAKDVTESENVLYDANKQLTIEKTTAAQLDAQWLSDRGLEEYFDFIVDELCHEQTLYVDSKPVQTTIFGLCLKPSGLLYVVDRRISGDIAGIKLRKKISALYPNSHFELVAERDTPWTTQFVFLKADSCDTAETGRDAQRVDYWGDSHKQHVQDSIHGNEVLRNAGRNMVEAEKAVLQKMGVKIDPDQALGDGPFR